jgi:hypothetical protein
MGKKKAALQRAAVGTTTYLLVAQDGCEGCSPTSKAGSVPCFRTVSDCRRRPRLQSNTRLRRWPHEARDGAPRN